MAHLLAHANPAFSGQAVALQERHETVSRGRGWASSRGWPLALRYMVEACMSLTAETLCWRHSSPSDERPYTRLNLRAPPAFVARAGHSKPEGVPCASSSPHPRFPGCAAAHTGSRLGFDAHAEEPRQEPRGPEDVGQELSAQIKSLSAQLTKAKSGLALDPMSSVTGSTLNGVVGPNIVFKGTNVLVMTKTSEADTSGLGYPSMVGTMSRPRRSAVAPTTCPRRPRQLHELRLVPRRLLQCSPRHRCQCQRRRG